MMARIMWSEARSHADDGVASIGQRPACSMVTSPGQINSAFALRRGACTGGGRESGAQELEALLLMV